jgi:NhaA family Na+:H+ antiporter
MYSDLRLRRSHWSNTEAIPVHIVGRQLAGAAVLAGISFTMSLFIAGQAFPVAPHSAAAKIAVFGVSVLAATVGAALLWGAPPAVDD